MFNTSDVYIYSQNFFHENMRRRFFTYMLFNESVENLHLLGSEKTSDLPVREIFSTNSSLMTTVVLTAY